MKARTSLPLILLIFLLSGLIGACKSDEARKREAESLVKSFVDELNMENFNSARAIYPGMNDINRYNVLQNFTISSSSIRTQNNKKEVSVMGDYGIGQLRKSIQFVVGETESVDMAIIQSKGLTHYYESPLYNILKRSGCLSNIESDAIIHKECKIMEPKFEALVSQYREQIERGVLFEKNGSRLTNNYNIHITGELMLRNTLNIQIPSYSYDIYILLYDRSGTMVHSNKYDFSSDPILANQLHQVTVYSLNYGRGFKSYSAILKIKDDAFIRQYLAQQGNLNCSDLL